MNPTKQVQKAKLQYYQNRQSTSGVDLTIRNDIRNILNPAIGDVPPPFISIGCCYTSSTNTITSSNNDVVPSFVPVLSVSSGSAILSWSYAGTDQLGFNIEKSISDANNFSNIFVLANPTSRSYTDDNVSTPNTYYYKINAYNAIGTGSYSNVADITFVSVLAAPSYCITPPFQASLITGSLTAPTII